MATDRAHADHGRMGSIDDADRAIPASVFQAVSIVLLLMLSLTFLSLLGDPLPPG